MKTLSLSKVSLFSITLAILSSCQDNVVDQIESESITKSGSNYQKLEDNRIAFAKTFAKALSNVDIRNLIKSEAEKQFNNDTEVLYQMIKNKQLANSITVNDYLASIYGSKSKFEELTDALPLLTILVPHLYRFSIDQWNVDNTTPKVAVLPNPTEENVKSKSLVTFDNIGTEGIVYKNTPPNFPILVIKDNERIKVSSEQQDYISNRARVAFSGTKYTYTFLDDSFDGSLSKNKRVGTYDTFDSRAKYAFSNELQYHRDYIYYGIDPEHGVNSGSLKSNYKECITAMKFVNTQYWSNLNDDPSTDWTDGNFEFIVNIYLVENQSSLGQIQKVFGVDKSELFYFDSNGNPTDAKEYTFPVPIDIITWDMQKYGDTWKFTVIEQDQQTTQTTTTTSTITSKFGFNFSIGIKDGPNFGINGGNESTSTQTYTLTVTGGSDVLGDAILQWTDNVMTGHGEGDILVHGQPVHYNIGYSKAIGTGTVELSVEPFPR